MWDVILECAASVIERVSVCVCVYLWARKRGRRRESGCKLSVCTHRRLRPTHSRQFCKEAKFSQCFKFLLIALGGSCSHNRVKKWLNATVGYFIHQTVCYFTTWIQGSLCSGSALQLELTVPIQTSSTKICSQSRNPNCSFSCWL